MLAALGTEGGFEREDSEASARPAAAVVQTVTHNPV